MIELKDHQLEDLQSVGESSAAVLLSLLFCILQQALERESASIRRQLKDACIDIKCEMMSVVKAEVKKRLQKSHNKTLAMIVSVKQEIKDLMKLELSVAATGVSYVNAFSARLIEVLPQFMIQ